MKHPLFPTDLLYHCLTFGVCMTFCFDGAAADPLAGTAIFTDEEKTVLNDLRTLEPASQFRLAKATAIPGLFETVMRDRVIYIGVNPERFHRAAATREDYRYRLTGLMFDAVTGANYTAPLQKLASLADINDFDPKDAVIGVNGNGKRTLYVITDPLCPYCRRFESVLQKLPDVTIFTFIVALQGADSPSYEAALKLLTQPDPQKAWQHYIGQDDHPLPPITAKNLKKAKEQLSRNARLAQNVFLKGTPTSFFEDGSRLTGAVKADVLNERFKAIEQFKATALKAQKVSHE